MAVIDTPSTSQQAVVPGDERKPMLSSRAIVLMNVGFFGIQFSFGLQQTAVNPIFQLIGARPDQLPLLNLAGPVTGLLIQPMIGAMSDRTWSDKWGRRKPFFLVGALGCSIVLFLFPFVGALWTAVLFLWLLDASNNTAMEPYRAFISDRLPTNQLARGFLTQSLFVGAGAVTANLSLFVFQKVIGGNAGGLPYWVYVCFWIGAVCSIGSVLISTTSTKELPPTDEERAELAARPRGVGPSLGEIRTAVREMPMGMHKIGLVFLFQWFAMAVYWQFVTLSMGESAFNATPDDARYQDAIGWTGLVNGSYNLVTVFAAIALIGVAAKYGAKRVHAGALIAASAAMLVFPHITNQYLLFLPMIFLGICWASMLGIPYILVVSMVPKERTGVYMGILNMMIVVPMLIETVTFGWIFEHLLGGHGTNAISFMAVMLGLAALAMLWVNDPKPEDESPLMPLGAPRQISVYDRVVVGSDGTPTSLYAVDRAAEVAAAAEARLIIVSAYNEDETAERTTAEGLHRDLYGIEAARAALAKSTPSLEGDRIRFIDQRIVPGDPAQALLDTAASPASLIVVGNRGLGAVEGQLLGSVPGNVVKNATCDVLVVQTSALDDGAHTAGTETTYRPPVQTQRGSG